MKKNLLIEIAAWFIILSLPTAIHAQVTSNYVLSPAPAWTLPTGATMELSIVWYDSDGTLHKGINEYVHNDEPIWTINGKRTYNSNPKDGKLTLNPNNTKATIYTAPDKIPSTNPVNIAVSFKANDSSKEQTILMCNVKIVAAPKKWVVSFNYNKTVSETDKSEVQERTDKSSANANCVMIIKGYPPRRGQTLINTGDGDSVVSYSSSGHYTRNLRDIEEDINGKETEKTIRNYSGTVNKIPPGIEFEYDPGPGGVKGIAGGGLSFDVSGTDEFWKRDIDNDKWIVTKNDDSSPNGAGVSLGNPKDILKKTSDGFTIGYNNSKDTSYTEDGTRHAIHSTETYHVTISWMNENKAGIGKGKKED